MGSLFWYFVEVLVIGGFSFLVFYKWNKSKKGDPKKEGKKSTKNERSEVQILEEKVELNVDLENSDGTEIKFLIKKFKSLRKLDQKHSFLMEFLKGKISEAMDVGQTVLHVQQPLSTYGMSSLTAIKLTSELGKSIGVKMSPTLLFNYPTIEKIGYFLETEIFKIRRKVSEKIVNRLLSNPNLKEPIAVIGIGCNFPGGSIDVQNYWKLLHNGESGIIEVPPSRWSLEEYYSSNPQDFGKMVTKSGGFISDVETFDPAFFNLSNRECEYMDPQQRLLLQLSYQTFENASILPKTLFESLTGVFIASCGSDYGTLLNRYKLKNPGDKKLDYRYIGTGISSSVLAGRLSFFYGLKGPALTLDTACSSSLVTTHLACQSLRVGECSLALAGGVNLTLDPEIYVTFSKTKMLSPDGQCKTFDDSANGYVRGEGCGLVLLKRLSDAQRDGDRILAVIKGSAMNQDGKSAGITAPSGLSQEMVIKTALYNAGVHPNEVDYVEAHGTGTSLGDPIEMQSLCSVFGGLNRKKTLYVGSAKTNIGHLEGAAGIAGLLKIILALNNEEIPQHLNLKKLNHRLPPLQLIPITIPYLGGQSWERDEDEKRIAGVSSFGFSGTNSHIIVEEAPFFVENLSDDDESDESDEESEEIRDVSDIFCVSARSDYSLKKILEKYIEFLKKNGESIGFNDFCFTQNTTRTHFEKRIAIKCSGIDSVTKKIEKVIQEEDGDEVGVFKNVRNTVPPKIVFFFTGQGSQYTDMGKELYETQRVFKKWLDECDKICRKYLKESILNVIFKKEHEKKLNSTQYCQPVLFAIEYSVAMMYKEMGIVADYLLGHSLGEIVAACVSEVFSLQEGLRMVCLRAKYMDSTAKGAMAAIFTSKEVVEKVLKETKSDVSIASVNGPTSIVVSGVIESIESLLKVFGEKKIKTRSLNVERGFHSILMNPILKDFEEGIKDIQFEMPYIPVVSNLYGEIIDGMDIEFSSKYWKDHIRNPVEFYTGIKKIIEKEKRNLLFVEVGPKPHLSSMARRIVGNRKDFTFVSTMKEGKEHLYNALCEIFIKGVSINWEAFYQNDLLAKRKRIVEFDLPVYQFQQKRFWIRKGGEKTFGGMSSSHPLLGSQFSLPSQTVFQAEFDKEMFKDHVIFGIPILPATSYLEMSMGTIQPLFKMDAKNSKVYCLENLSFDEPISVKNNQTIQTVCKHVKRDTFSVEIFTVSSGEENSWKRHSSCQVTTLEEGKEELDVDIEALLKMEKKKEFDVAQLYDQIVEKGFNYGPTYQCLKSLSVLSEDESLGVIEMHKTVKNGGDLDYFSVHHTIVDSCLHCIMPLAADLDKTFLPFMFRRVEFYNGNKSGKVTKIYAHVKVTKKDEKSIVSDLRIFDFASKELLIKIDGFVVREVSKSLLLKLLDEEMKIFYEVRWKESRPRKSIQSKEEIKLLGKEKTTIVVFNDKGDLGKTIFHLLKENFDVVTVEIGDSFKKDGNMFVINPKEYSHFKLLFEDASFKEKQDVVVCYLWGLDLGEKSILNFDNLVSISCGSLLYLTQSLFPNKIQVRNLFVVTRDVFSPSPNCAQSIIHGFCRSLAVEHQDLGLVRIDLGEKKKSLGLKDALTIVSEMFMDHKLNETFFEDEVSIKNGKRFAPQLVPTSISDEKDKEITEASFKKSMIIAGGTKGLGLEIGRYFLKKGFKKVVLVGRSVPKDAKKLEQEGFSLERGDVCDLEGVRKIFDKNKPVYGVVNCAGVWEDGLVVNQKFENYTKVLNPKVMGSWNLHIVSEEYKVEDFILFSSVASILGSPGQTNYCAANFFLDSLASYRRSCKLPAFVINWGGWGEIGLASRKNMFVERFGLFNFSPKEGIDVFEKLFNLKFEKRSQIIPVLVNWVKLLNSKTLPLPSMFEAVKEQYKWKKKETSKKLKKLRKKLFSFQDKTKRKDFMVAQVQNKVAKVLQTEADEVDIHKPMMDLGMDSLTAVELRNSLIESVGIQFSATVFFDYPNIEKISEYLLKTIIEEGNAEEKPEIMKKDVKKSPSLLSSLKPKVTMKNEPIAIIGYSCRLPTGTLRDMGNGPKGFWEMLMSEKGCSEEIPPNRFDYEEFFDKEGGEKKIYVKWGTFINEPFKFDPLFFGISTQEAKAMDPQQRLLLEVAWETMESANIVPKSLVGSKTGVFVGNMFLDYRNLVNKYEVVNYAGTGNHLSVLAGRVSYVFGFQGPVITMDTACSSSLVTTHLACQSLRSGECNCAIAGGVNLLISPENYVSECNMRMLSPVGLCKTFDDSADGYLRGEGCGLVLLKRLSDAQRDGNRILGIVRGSAVNHDGRSAGLTAPNGESQERVIKDSLKMGNLVPDDIDYIEAHGTGTSLGDPIEIRALGNVFGKQRKNPLYVSSAKTYIGHAEGCAGIAGVLKLVMSLNNERIPRHLNFKKLNKLLPNLEEHKIVIPHKKGIDWKRSDDRKRIGSVSSFGFSGTNAHMVIEEPPLVKRKKSQDYENFEQLLALSAKSEYSIKEMAMNTIKYLQENEDVSLNDYSYTVNTRKSVFDLRLGVFGQNKKEVISKLHEFISCDIKDRLLLEKKKELFSYGAVGKAKRKIVFCFTGQGSQYYNMGKELYEKQPVFKLWMDKCDAILKKHLGVSILDILYRKENEKLLHSTLYSQPAIFSIEYSLAMMYKAIGILPDYLIGHSLGEVVAACFSEVFSLEDGLQLICSRAKFMDKTAEGSMAAIFTQEDAVRKLIKETGINVSVASMNGQTNTVVSGTKKNLSSFLQVVTERKIKFRALAVERGFHSELMDPALLPFEESIKGIKYNEPMIPIVSNLFGEIIETFEEEKHKMDEKYWVKHIRNPVQFLHGIQAITKNTGKNVMFLEVGARSHLIGMTKRILADVKDVAYVESMKEGKYMLFSSICGLFTGGLEFEFAKFYEVNERNTKNKRYIVYDTPFYPFQKDFYTVVPKSDQILRDTVYETEWKEAMLSSKREDFGNLNDGSVLIFADKDKQGVSRKLGEFLKVTKNVDIVGFVCDDSAKSVKKIHPKEKIYSYNPNNKDHFDKIFQHKVWEKLKKPKYIVHMCSLDVSNEMEDRKKKNLKRKTNMLKKAKTIPIIDDELIKLSIMRNGFSLVNLIQGIQRNKVSARVFCITKNVNNRFVMFNKTVKDDPVPSIFQSYAWGMSKTIRLEHPELEFKIIDIENSTTLKSLYHELIVQNDKDQEISFLNGKRYVPRIKIKEFKKNLSVNSFKITPKDTYIVTGGTSGLGFEFTKMLIERRGLKNVVLLSRSGIKSEAIGKELKRLCTTIPNVRILIEKADVSNEASLRNSLINIFQKRKVFTSLTGIIHCAGVFDTRLISDKEFTLEKFSKLYLPKVNGSLYLHKIVNEELKIKVKKFVLFSSDVSQFGDRGQVTYASVNAFLDYFAHYVRQVSQVDTIAINWGLFGDVGGVVSTQGKENLLSEKTLTLLKYSGQGLLNAKKGFAVFEKILADKSIAPRVGVVVLHWKNLIRYKFDGIIPAFISDVQFQKKKGDGKEEEVEEISIMAKKIFEIEEKTENKDEREKQELAVVSKDVTSIVEDMLDKEEGQLDVNADLGDLGVDSITALSIRNNLSKYTGIVLPVNMAFTNPTILGIAEFVYLQKGKVIEKAKKVLSSSSGDGGHAVEVSTEISFFENIRMFIKNYVRSLVRKTLGDVDLRDEDHLHELEANVQLTNGVRNDINNEFKVNIDVREFFRRATINRYSNLVLKGILPKVEEKYLFKELDLPNQLPKSLGYIYETNWVHCPVPQPDAKLRLFMTPPAGMNPSFYRKVVPYFPKDVELCMIHLPGRTSRLNESLMINMMELASEVTDSLSPLISKKGKNYKPYAFFGHCMGTQINFEIVCEIKKRKLLQPEHFYVFSGHSPYITNSLFPDYQLDDNGILGFIKQTNNGVLPKPLENKEMNKLVFAIMRADLQKVSSQDIVLKKNKLGKQIIYHNYFKREIKKFGFGITAWGGGKDQFVPSKYIQQWKNLTKKEFKFKIYPNENHYPYVDVMGEIKKDGPAIIGDVVKEVKLLL